MYHSLWLTLIYKLLLNNNYEIFYRDELKRILDYTDDGTIPWMNIIGYDLVQARDHIIENRAILNTDIYFKNLNIELPRNLIVEYKFDNNSNL